MSTRIPQRPKLATPLKTQPKATKDDAIWAGIPSGYSIENWDCTEVPILLLGSVFDANSLGKWIYNWTVFHYGANAPVADIAGNLWISLIRLAGKVKHASECAAMVCSHDAREILEDFLKSGERLWARFKKLLNVCELYYMWKAATQEGTQRGVNMGPSSGREFIDSIIGHDREWKNMEKLLDSIQRWNMQFDASCDDILMHSLA